MARRSPSVIVGAVLVSCAALAAQQRAPCTGVLRTADGAPLAGAEVTFAFEPGIVTPGERDRVTATTDQQGHFAGELVLGNVYTVWAIGPADEKGVRAMCRPAANAAAGWPLELAAADRRGPVRVQVAGTAPWIAEGPLALRVCVAGPLALRDVPVPGDGPIALPPCPTDVVALALLDGRGGIISVRTIDLATPAVVFAAPREIDVIAHDDQGAALAGVRIVQSAQSAVPQVETLLDSSQLGDRLLAITDAGGRARVRAPFTQDGLRFLLLHADAPGHSRAIAGWANGKRLAPPHGAIPADDDPLEFELPLAPPTQARIAGLPGSGASGWYRQQVDAVFATGNTEMQCVAVPGVIRDGTCTMPASVHGAFMRLCVPQSGGVHTSAWCYGKGELCPIDLDALRTFQLVVVDDVGQPAAGTQIGIASTGGSSRIEWLDRFALPADGRIALRLPYQDLVLYAATAAAHGAAVVSNGRAPGELRIVLQPIPVVTLRAVDEAGAPVAGARVEWLNRAFRTKSKEAEDHELDRISFERGVRLLGLACSDATGMLRLPFPARASEWQVKVRAGARRSTLFALQPGTALQAVVVK
jgi:hypothetical protein